MTNLQRAKKYFIGSLIVLFVALGMFGVLLWYLNKQAATLSTVLYTIAEQTILKDKFTTLSATVENSADDRLFLEQVIIDGENGVVAYLAEIETLAQVFGVTVTTSDLKVLSEEALSFKRLSVKMTVEGTQDNVEGFIATFEQMPYAQHITKFTFANTEIERQPVTTATFDFNVIMK